jgi:mono/diheme cytochrome c family protein
MRKTAITLFAAFILIFSSQEFNPRRDAASETQEVISGVLVREWHTGRSSPLDLELGGDLKGLPSGTTRFVTRDDLLALPQVSFTATDDEKFTAPTRVSGVALDQLMRALEGTPHDMLVAMCNDGYRANYTSAYIAAHHPLLVLEIDGKAPPDWPRDAEHGTALGPYTVTHLNFTPRFKIFSQADEPLIPWGVFRLDLRQELSVFGAIAPHGPHANDPVVQAGYRIARQNCFRCHNAGREGGQKSQRPWLVLSAWATAAPDFFTAYVRDPRTKNPLSAMPGNQGYDDSTMRALIAYFQTFSAPVSR